MIATLFNFIIIIITLITKKFRNTTNFSVDMTKEYPLDDIGDNESEVMYFDGTERKKLDDNNSNNKINVKIDSNSVPTLPTNIQLVVNVDINNIQAI